MNRHYCHCPWIVMATRKRVGCFIGTFEPWHPIIERIFSRLIPGSYNLHSQRLLPETPLQLKPPLPQPHKQNYPTAIDRCNQTQVDSEMNYLVWKRSLPIFGNKIFRVMHSRNETRKNTILSYFTTQWHGEKKPKHGYRDKNRKETIVLFLSCIQMLLTSTDLQKNGSVN